MKRLQRALIAILCVVCLAFGMIACGEDPKPSGDKATYTVTVKAGNGVSGTDMRVFTVKLIDAEGKDAAAAKTLTLNEAKTEGTAKFSLKKGNYTVEMGELGSFYVQGTVTLTATVTKTTLTVTDQAPPAPKTEYKVLFKLPNGDPVPNLDVQICKSSDSGQCYPATTDADGWAKWEQPADTYEVHVPQANWPNGYYFDDTAYELTSSVTSLNVEFKAFIGHKVKFSYADESTYDDYAFGACNPGEPAAGVKFDVYKHTNAFGGGKEGEKLLTVTTDADGIAEFDAYEACWIENVIDVKGCVIGKEGVNVVNTENEQLNGTGYQQFILHKPGAANSAPISLVAGTAQTVSFTADSKDVWFDFPLKASGVYTVTSSGADTVAKTVRLYSQTGTQVGFYADIIAENKENPNYDERVVFAEADNNFTITLSVSEVYTHGSGAFLFAIGADGATEAGEFTVTLTRTGDYEEPKAPDKVSVEPKGIIPVAEMPAVGDDMKFVRLNKDTDEVVKGDDGYYHLYTKTGLIIYASFGSKYAPYNLEEGFGAAIEGSGGIGFTFSDGKTYNDDYTEFVKAYVDAVNEDGLHPLNDEILRFLNFYGTQSMGLLDWGEKGAYAYYFASGYYVAQYQEITLTDEGGKKVGVIAAYDDFKVEVPANTTVEIANMIAKRGDIGYLDAAITLLEDTTVKMSATADGAAVKKLNVNGAERFFLKNESAAAVTVKFNAFYVTADEEITAAGTYLLKASLTPVTYTFVAPEAGYYQLDYDDDNYSWNLQDPEGRSPSNLVELSKGGKLTIEVVPFQEDATPVVEITITKVTAPASLIVGANKNVIAKSGGVKYTFTAPAAGKFTFTSSEYECLVASANNVDAEITDPVTLTEGQVFEFWAFSIFSPVQIFTLTISEGGAPQPDPENPIAVNGGETLILGQKYTVKANGDVVNYSFTAQEAGTYVLTSESDNAILGYDSDTGMVETTTITMTAGQTVTICCTTVDWQEDTYDLIITKQAA